MKSFLVIEPFYGGSHKEFVKGLVEYSSHKIDVVTMPGVNWKWRLDGSAIFFARQNIRFSDYDGIIVSGMLRLSDLKALCGHVLPPVLVYFHETQSTYPEPLKGRKTYKHAARINEISSSLCADIVVFNSEFHRNAFLESVSEYISGVPDYPIDKIRDDIEKKSKVIYPGVDFPDDLNLINRFNSKEKLVIWNHRWSYDKNAPSFFYAVEKLMKEGSCFNLAILGEHDEKRIPDVFLKARESLSEHILQFGYVHDRDEYFSWLEKGSMVVSAAIQENFGMSVVEAMGCGCLPLLPARLSYPEILPERFHDLFIYRNQKEFLTGFQRIINMKNESRTLMFEISESMKPFLWKNRIAEYDDILYFLSSLGADNIF